MSPEFIPWIILFLPLAAAAIITLGAPASLPADSILVGRDAGAPGASGYRTVSATLSILAVVAGFILSIIFISWAGWQPAKAESTVTWLAIADLQIDLGLRFDPLSLLMMLIVTGVASAIHIYSWGYMRDDPGFSRYFASLSLFTFSMLGIVLANNFVELFIFWELVGVSSYLLIGFWFERPAAADAGKKAFITTRLGDFGFILGILLVWATLHSLNFGELQNALRANPAAFGTAATIAGLLIFCGAMGKSAQFPLHVWLPDAMEGPTPVSALIHAATMVAAGVYMLCRVLFLLTLPGSNALPIIACIGGFTALLSAVIAIQQNDLKRILAYSTLSQLGYMVMSVGLSGPTPAMFHLTTHAFFKALLFLGAGSIIIALHHEQDIWKMGALRQKMPVTFWTFLAGTLAIAGVPPLSGFFSKDSILGQALEQSNPWLKYGFFALGVFVAILTAFYMFRLLLIVFYAPAKSDLASRAHESPSVMVWPLRILALFSIIGGFIGIEWIYHAHFSAAEAAPALSFGHQLIFPFAHAPWAATFGLLAAAIGFAAAYRLYFRAAQDPLPQKLGSSARVIRNRFYFDEIYEATVIPLHEFLASIAGFCDRWIIAGFIVRGTHGTTELAGRALRLLQSGNLQAYVIIFTLGVGLVLYLALVW